MIALPGALRDEEWRREWIEALLHLYAADQPAEAEQFIEYVKEVRRNLHTQKAMSKGGTLCEVMNLPEKIEGCMNELFGKQWKNDLVTRRSFLQVAAAFRVNTTSMPTKVLDRPHPYAY